MTETFFPDSPNRVSRVIGLLRSLFARRQDDFTPILEDEPLLTPEPIAEEPAHIEARDSATESFLSALRNSQYLSNSRAEWITQTLQEHKLRASNITAAELVIAVGFVSPARVIETIQKQRLHMPLPSDEAGLFAIWPAALLKQLGVVPIRLHNGRLYVMATRPLADFEKRLITDQASANDHRIDEIVVETYSTVQVLAKLQEAPHVTGVGLNALLAKHDIASAPTDLTHTLDSLCVDAIERRASDLHIEIGADMVETRIQYRVGNNLLFRATLSPLLATRLTTLIRERCGIDTSNTDAPHEGAFTFKNHGRPIEARVAIMPTRSGQSITIRLADTRSFQTLDDILGNFPELAERLKADIPVGTRTAYLKIIAGPMNQGKSTTYRALMMEHPRERIKILEVGDPVEQPIPLTTQTNVNRHPNIGLDHTVFLEHALRHDADVVSISEIRDEKTAPELLRFVESGHGGYTTLHTDNALDAIPRFFSLIPKQRSQAADIFGRYVHWILHQRLVPTPCPHCSSTISTTKLDPNVCALLGVSEHKDVISLSDDGCSECSGQSERGRTLAPEVIWVKRSARNAFARKLSQIVLGQIDADYSTILEIDGIELIPRRDFLLALMSQKEIAWQTAYSELRREADHD